MFVLQSIVAGLAIAFLVLLIAPGFIDQSQQGTRPAAPVYSGQFPDSFSPAVQSAAPAVVNIFTRRRVTQRKNPMLEDPLFQRFFGEALSTPEKKLQTSLGSGVIVSAGGYILTNHHVIESADEIQVYLRDGTALMAQVVGSDPETDIAVLALPADRYPAITIGNSDALAIGDVVLAIGNPFGVGQTVTQGIVSATGRRQASLDNLARFIQTDAAVNPGNSGGALVDVHGHLVGINTAIVPSSGGAQGISFAVPSKAALTVLRQIVDTGIVVRGWLGIEVQDITRSASDELGLNGAGGVIIEKVMGGGPADHAGLIPGDVITHIDRNRVYDSRDAREIIAFMEPGTRTAIRVRRSGRLQMYYARVSERPRRMPPREPPPDLASP